MNNTENNTTMMKSLKGLLYMCNLNTFDAKKCQIFCFPHTTNICTGHIVSSLSSSPIDREPNENHIIPREQMYEQAIAHDPIAIACTAIQTIQLSSAHRDAFTAVIRDGNMDGWWVRATEEMVVLVYAMLYVHGIQPKA